MGGLDLTTISKLLLTPLPEQERVIKLVVTEHISKAEQYFKRELIIPELHYDLEGSVAGRASKSKIWLNVELLHNEWDSILAQIIPHEVAHSVAFQLWNGIKPHGREWQHVMRVFGLQPDRCHAYETKPKRVHPRPYIYSCDCKEHAITNLLHKRMQQGKKYTCTICGADLKYEREAN